MGGKNRSKKKEGLGSSSSTKKSATVKVGNKLANKRARAQGQKESESRSKSSLDKRAVKQANKASGVKARVNDGENAESRKKAKRKSKGGATGAPSVKQMRQHAHEARAMSRHDEDFNDRAQVKADRKAGKLSAKEESERLAREEEMREPEANAADLRYFEKNQQLSSFLENLNEDDLKWTKEDRAKPKPKFPTQAPGKAKLTGNSDEEDEDDDEDDDDEDEDDDEEDDDEDDDDDEPAPSSKKKTSLEALERGGARKPSWAAESKTQKDRLPIRNADGSWGVSEIAKHDALRARAEALEKLQKKQEEMEARKARIAAGEDEEDDEAEIDEEADASEQDEDEDAEMEDAEQNGGNDENAGAQEDEVDEDEEMSDFDDEIPNDSDLEAELVAEEAMEQDLGEAEDENSESMKEKQARRQYRLKCELAENSESILENPEKNIGKLEPMLQLCQDSDLTVQQYALMSCVEVLVDLMPAYRIRMPTEEEEAKNLSKDTKTTWKFERSYLLYYGRLINLIMSYTKKIFNPQTNDRTTISAFGMNLLRCGSRLLEKGHAFNYRKELIHLISPFLNHVASKIRTLVFQTLVTIFRSDIAGESTLEITRILTKIVKEKGRRANVEVLQIFLYLPLHKEILQADTGEDKKKAAEPKKKKFQHIRIDEAEFTKDQQESEAVVSVATRKKIQTQLLTELFTAYFRVLKQDKNSKLLPTVLKGLSKFASLIDIEIVLDLLDCLKATINPENEDPLTLESSLYVILTSFTTLKSHGQALNLDLKEFYNCLYGLLLDFANNGETEQIAHLPLLLQCLQLMFHETKQLSVDRVASFIKRLSTLCLYTPPYAALSLMHAIRLCLNKYPKAKALLDREATASGVHLAEIDDPDLVNPFASTAWELGLMKAHYHPFLPVYASSILDDENLPLSLARMSPQALFENYDTSEGGFNPPLPLPALFVGGAANPAATSATMKKKLDLKRRILMQQLAATVKQGRFQSDFLKKLNGKSQNTKPASSMNQEELKKRLEKLRQLKAQSKKARAAASASHSSNAAAATASNNNKSKLNGNSNKRPQPSSASPSSSNKKQQSSSEQPQKKQKLKH